MITPIVAALTTPSGTPLREPVQRDTSKRADAIIGVIGENAVPVKLGADKLVSLALA